MSYYKVLRNISGVLKSYLICLDFAKFSLIYKPGEITEPKIGKLFVFSDLYTALEWRTAIHNEVWEVEVGNPTINHRILDHNDVSESNVVNFWNNTYNISKCAPDNTVFCDYVKLLKRIR